MTDAINFTFWTLSQMWNVIVANWILAFSVLVLIIGWVVGLISSSMKK